MEEPNARRTTTEPTRVVVNLDFSIVVPAGATYEVQNTDLHQDKVLFFTDGYTSLSIYPPKAIGDSGRGGFDDPIARGVIRNFTARLISERYGHEEKQTVVVDTKKIMALCATRSDRKKGVGFAIAADKGLYEGYVLLPKMNDRDRVGWVKELLSSVGTYNAAPDEDEAAKQQVLKQQKENQQREEFLRSQEEILARKEQERARKEEEKNREAEEAAPQETEPVPEEPEPVSAPAPEPEPVPAPAEETTVQEEEAEPVTEPAAQEEAPAAEEEETTETAPAKEEAPVTEEEEAKQEIEASAEPSPEAEEEAAPEPDAVSEEAAAPETEDTEKEEKTEDVEDEKKTEEERELIEEEKHIRELEVKRHEMIEQMRTHYSGNPEVEAQIDNYIARVQHTADKISDEFTAYVGQVQDYVAHTPFTSPEDENFVSVLDGLTDAENKLGSQLDEIVENADQNASNAKEAGVKESFMEKLIRLMERLGRIYENLVVTMPLSAEETKTIAYEKPEKIDQILTKWADTYYLLPSTIEKSEKEVERRASERIRTRIQQSRERIEYLNSILDQTQEAMFNAQDAADAQQSAFDEAQADFDAEEEEIHAAEKDHQTRNSTRARQLNLDLQKKNDELMQLNQQLSKTFSLNVNKKRDLNGKIADVEDEIDKLKSDIAANREEKDTLHEQYDVQLSDLAERRKKAEEDNEAVKQAAVDAKDTFEGMKEEIETLKQTIADSEEEWKHVHENYLLGKYDPS